jgi:segregation and condensation protein B
MQNLAGPLELKLVIEALLFSSQKPMTVRDLRDLLTQAAQDPGAREAAGFRKVRDSEIEVALTELERDHEQAGRSYRLVCVANAWQFVTTAPYAPWLRVFLGRTTRPPRLSQPALETLTIIAYRQPVTRAEIEQIRGVNVDGVMQTLLERGLVIAAGRGEGLGRPVTYGTTPAFLTYFGLRAIEDLPAADELRRIPVTRPEGLLTVDSGLATPPPDPASLQADQPPQPEGHAPNPVSSEPTD